MKSIEKKLEEMEGKIDFLEKRAKDASLALFEEKKRVNKIVDVLLCVIPRAELNIKIALGYDTITIEQYLILLKRGI